MQNMNRPPSPPAANESELNASMRRRSVPIISSLASYSYTSQQQELLEAGKSEGNGGSRRSSAIDINKQNEFSVIDYKTVMDNIAAEKSHKTWLYFALATITIALIATTSVLVYNKFYPSHTVTTPATQQPSIAISPSEEKFKLTSTNCICPWADYCGPDSCGIEGIQSACQCTSDQVCTSGPYYQCQSSSVSQPATPASVTGAGEQCRCAWSNYCGPDTCGNSGANSACQCKTGQFCAGGPNYQCTPSPSFTTTSISPVTTVTTTAIPPITSTMSTTTTRARTATTTSTTMIPRTTSVPTTTTAITTTAAAGGSVGGATRGLMAGYFATWLQQAQLTAAQLDLAQLDNRWNVVYLSFMFPNAQYTKGQTDFTSTGVQFTSTPDEIRQAIQLLRAKNPGVRIVISVGGATYFQWGSLNTQAIADFVADFNLDGVDIDYEPDTGLCDYSTCCTADATGKISCKSDSQYISSITAIRLALNSIPTNKKLYLSTAAWSIGAYGEGQFTNAVPKAGRTGLLLNTLRDPAASAALDVLNVMSYTASTDYSLPTSLAAYQYAASQGNFKGTILMGFCIPAQDPFGPYFTTTAAGTMIQSLVRSGAGGAFLWYIQGDTGYLATVSAGIAAASAGSSTTTTATTTTKAATTKAPTSTTTTTTQVITSTTANTVGPSGGTPTSSTSLITGNADGLTAASMIAPLPPPTGPEKIWTNVYVTFYGFDDNDNGAGQFATSVISNPTIHPYATQDLGTYEHPSTWAGDEQFRQVPAGTIIYVPKLRKYFIQEDTCAECTTDANNGKVRMDMYIGDNFVQGNPLINCEDTMTANPYTDIVVTNPKSTYPVFITPIFHSGVCTTTTFPTTGF